MVNTTSAARLALTVSRSAREAMRTFISSFYLGFA
jgi:hypothetical protein